MGSSLELVLTIFHLIIAVTLIGLVLIQDSKSGAMGVLGSGNSSSILGATGATSLAAKLTRWTAALFAASCLALAVMSARSDKSVIDGVMTSAPTTQEPIAPTNETQAAPAATGTTPPVENKK